jgi:hypothetical protein
MQIRLIRDDLGVAASAPDSEQMTEQSGRRFWLRGAIIDVPERAAVLLVGNGDAEPADDEAERACKGWQNNRQQVLLSREMLAKGIEPEDREAYRAGEFEGYDENGNKIGGSDDEDSN